VTTGPGADVDGGDVADASVPVPGKVGLPAVARLKEGGKRRPNARFGKSVAMRP
jgi:hypothetical protein